jgi:hypothetical protein
MVRESEEEGAGVVTAALFGYKKGRAQREDGSENCWIRCVNDKTGLFGRWLWLRHVVSDYPVTEFSSSPSRVRFGNEESQPPGWLFACVWRTPQSIEN